MKWYDNPSHIQHRNSQLTPYAEVITCSTCTAILVSYQNNLGVNKNIKEYYCHVYSQMENTDIHKHTNLVLLPHRMYWMNCQLLMLLRVLTLLNILQVKANLNQSSV